jgi:DNA end-binding protein Ku
MLQALLWADEVRDASFPALDTSIRISAQEREMSAALVESMASDFEPAQFTDDYQAQLRQLIEAKLEKGDALDTEETFGAEAEGGKGEVIDLMEALKRSLDKKRGGGPAAQETSEDESSEDEPSGPAKRSGRSSSRSSTAKKDAEDSDAETAKSGTARTRSKTAGAAKTSAASKTSTAAKTSAASKTGTASAASTASKTGAGSKTGAASKTSTAAKSTAKTARKGA